MQKWSETGVIIREKLTSSGEISPSTQYLHFPSLSYQDTGVYMCGAENGVENVISTGTVYLLVKGKHIDSMSSCLSHVSTILIKNVLIC